MGQSGNRKKSNSFQHQINTQMLNKAIVGGGCFWCIEALFQRIKGVEKIESGYIGGLTKNPTYQDICSGKTGHAQAVRIYFNPHVIQYQTLLYIFMHLHDPTTLNRQGNDTGTQYRSIIAYEKQDKHLLDIITVVLKQVQKEGQYQGYPNKIVTQVRQIDQFYVAQEYHQNYYNENQNQGYCKAVIKPKIGKLQQIFKEYINKPGHL